MNRIKLYYTCLWTCFLFAPFLRGETFEKMPQVIDFSSFNCFFGQDGCDDEFAVKLGFAAFNYASEINTVFSILKKEYHIDTVVETGTYKGASTQLFSVLFDQVHTIEISPEFFNKAKTRFLNTPNVECHLGSSEQVLPIILPSLKNKPVIFYLDAHWNDHWPLLAEIKEIGKTHYDNCIIVIDDFKVPGRNDIPYDHYGIHECSYEYVKDQLDQIFTDYTYYYVIPKNLYSRAKFIAIPTALSVKMGF